MTLSLRHWWHLAAKRRETWSTHLGKPRATGAWRFVHRLQMTTNPLPLAFCDGTRSRGSLVALVTVVPPSLLVPHTVSSSPHLGIWVTLQPLIQRSPAAHCLEKPHHFYWSRGTGWPLLCLWAVGSRVSPCCIRRAREWLKLSKLRYIFKDWF